MLVEEDAFLVVMNVEGWVEVDVIEWVELVDDLLEDVVE